MFKKVIQRSLLILSILTLAFLITGCSFAKDMTGPKEDKSVKTEQQLNVSDEKSSNEEDDEPDSDEDEKAFSDKENKKKAEKAASKDNQKKSKPSTSNKNVNKKTSSSQSAKKSSAQPPKKAKEKPTKPEQKKNTLIYSIVISSNEVPLPPTEMEITDGETVLEALIRITQQKKIQMDYRGGRGGSAYVEGIANVYEFDRGQGSGWMYRVNGIFPDRGAGVVPLYAGDRVEWLYTTDLGKDLGANLQPFRR